MKILKSSLHIEKDYLVFLTSYSLLALIGLENRDPWSLSTIIWLPSGVLLWILSTKLLIHWPFYIITAGTLNVIFDIFSGRGLDISLTFTFVEMATILPVSMIWRKHIGRFIDFPTKKLMLSALVSVYVVSIIGGIASIIVLKLLGYPVKLSRFYVWSLSNSLGCLTFAPMFISRRYTNILTKASPYLYFIGILPLLIFILSSFLIENVLLQQLTLYCTMGVIFILSLELLLRSLTTYLLFFTIFVDLTTLYGLGPLSTAGIQGIQFTQLYLLTIVSISLLINSHDKHNQNTEDSLKFRLVNNYLKSKKPAFFQLSENFYDLKWRNTTSLLNISIRKLPTIMHLKAYIHPEDRINIDKCFEDMNKNPSEFSKCDLRLLVNNTHYHHVRFDLVHRCTSPGFIGAIIPVEEF